MAHVSFGTRSGTLSLPLLKLLVPTNVQTDLAGQEKHCMQSGILWLYTSSCTTQGLGVPAFGAPIEHPCSGAGSCSAVH